MKLFFHPELCNCVKIFIFFTHHMWNFVIFLTIIQHGCNFSLTYFKFGAQTCVTCITFQIPSLNCLQQLAAAATFGLTDWRLTATIEWYFYGKVAYSFSFTETNMDSTTWSIECDPELYLAQLENAFEVKGIMFKKRNLPMQFPHFQRI